MGAGCIAGNGPVGFGGMRASAAITRTKGIRTRAQEASRVALRVVLGNRRPAPKPEPGTKAERQRLDRAARRARNLALAYWIDGLVRSGADADLAAVARMCGVSRARVARRQGR